MYTKGSDPSSTSSSPLRTEHKATFYANGSPLTPGTISNPIRFLTAKQIIGWTIIGDVNVGSSVVDVRASSYAAYPSTTSVMGGNKPTLNNTRKTENISLAIDIATGSIVEFVLESVSVHTKITVILHTRP